MLPVPRSKVQYFGRAIQFTRSTSGFGTANAVSTRSISAFCTKDTSGLAVFRILILWVLPVLRVLWGFDTAVEYIKHLNYFGVLCFSYYCSILAVSTAHTANTCSISQFTCNFSQFRTARGSNTWSISGFDTARYGRWQ